MEETEKKKGKNWLLVLMFIIVLCLAGYIIYDKVFTPTVKRVESVESTIEKEDITDQDIAKTLHDSLIANDNTGLYYQDKITPAKSDDVRFIRFALVSYVNEKSIKLPNNICGAPSDDTSIYITKEDFNSYVNKKYNTSIKYDLPLYNASNTDSNIYVLYPKYTFESYEGKWAITCNGEDDGAISSKMTKAEKEGEYIYIYDKAAYCSGNGMYNGCSKYIDSDDVVVECDECTDSDCKKDTICPGSNGSSTLKNMAETIVDRSDSLATFKHTFKQVNGEYYWISTEVEQ